ncbi:alpha/beta hydrolase family protein [Streptomyces sp. NPDC001663]|uniref:alpha/beta hydrolase family protein n=1 Tax=Streptomyces sp. NPDC001663 TaxID=3364597 RepID=UPI0036B6EB01
MPTDPTAPRSRPARREFLRCAAAAAVLASVGTACSATSPPTGSAAKPTATPSPSSTSRVVSLPAPTGHWPIGTIDLHLVDRTRHDPLVPSKPFRELMVSVWYPAERGGKFPIAPWLTPAAAADWDKHSAPGLTIKTGAVDWQGIQTHARTGAPVARPAGKLPVVLFSSGDGGDRALGTTLVEELASQGYIVVTVDPTYEVDQVEFPSGRVERAAPLPKKLTPKVIAALLEKHSRARVADMKFVLRQIDALAHGRNPDAERKTLPAGLPAAMDLSRTGALGQSLGGSVAAQLAHDDPRISAAANLDGEFFGPVIRTGVTKPFLLMASDVNSFDNNASWKSFWTASTGWKHALHLRKAQHGSYTDLQVIFPQLTPHMKIPAASELIGTINPHRSLAAQRSAIAAFFDLHLKNRPTTLFDNPSGWYPEVEVLR